MRIAFIVNPIHINGGWSPWDTRIGGSEEAVVAWASELSARGHTVQVYHNGQHGLHGEVEYLPHEVYEPGDVTINVNYPQFPVQGKTVYYTTLTDNPDVSQFDAVACLTNYAKKHTNLPDRTVIVPLGYDPTHIYPQKKISKQCLYASSPDRGLDILLQAWPEVYMHHPDATLIVTYGVLGVDLPGVTCLGEADIETMDDLYRYSDIWCHPCTGGELYCIVGQKAQVAGCVPVIIPTMALAETVKEGFFAETASEYAQKLIFALSSPLTRDSIRTKLSHYQFPTWRDSTDQLLKVIESVL